MSDYYWPPLFAGIVGILTGSAFIIRMWYERAQERRRWFASGEWKRCQYCGQDFAHCVSQDVRRDAGRIVLVREYHCLTCDTPSWVVTPVRETNNGSLHAL